MAEEADRFQGWSGSSDRQQRQHQHRDQVLGHRLLRHRHERLHLYETLPAAETVQSYHNDPQLDQHNWELWVQGCDQVSHDIQTKF